MFNELNRGQIPEKIKCVYLDLTKIKNNILISFNYAKT